MDIYIWPFVGGELGQRTPSWHNALLVKHRDNITVYGICFLKYKCMSFSWKLFIILVLSVVLKLWDMIKILKDGTYRHARNEMKIKNVISHAIR